MKGGKTLIAAALLVLLSTAIVQAQKPVAGNILIAAEKLNDPRFQESVVLLLDTGKNGAVGLMLNFPTQAKLTKVFPKIKGLEAFSDLIYIGGPVEPEKLFLLLRTHRKIDKTFELMDEVLVGASEESIESLLKKRSSSENLRGYLGYAGWTQDQLEAEIDGGYWYISEADADLIFSANPAKLWHNLVQRYTGLQARSIGPLSVVPQ